MFWIHPEAAAMIAAYHGVTASGTASGTWGGTTDPAFQQWQSAMKDYAYATNSPGLPKVNFWMVVALPSDDYSDRIEWHHSAPMLVPASGSGSLAGIAKNKQELDQILGDDEEHVHLTYKVKIQGRKAWEDLLEFLAEHDMLEKE